MTEFNLSKMLVDGEWLHIVRVREFIKLIKENDMCNEWLRDRINKLAGDELAGNHSPQTSRKTESSSVNEDTPDVRNPPRERQRGEASGTSDKKGCGKRGIKICGVNGELCPNCTPEKSCAQCGHSGGMHSDTEYTHTEECYFEGCSCKKFKEKK